MVSNLYIALNQNRRFGLSRNADFDCNRGMTTAIYAQVVTYHLHSGTTDQILRPTTRPEGTRGTTWVIYALQVVNLRVPNRSCDHA